MKKLSKAQKRTLKIARYFARRTKPTIQNLSFYKASGVRYDKDGLTPQRAFLERTEKGVTRLDCMNRTEYLSLLVGHNSAAMHNKLWAEGFREESLFLSDFIGEPKVIREMARRARDVSLSKRYDYIVNN